MCAVQPGAPRDALPLRGRVPSLASSLGARERRRWASRQIRSRSLSARMFAEPNRVLSATAESVCVTSPPAQISSQYGCA